MAKSNADRAADAAFLAGYANATRGDGDEASNPFPTDTPEGAAWLDGFGEGKQDRADRAELRFGFGAPGADHTQNVDEGAGA